MMKKPFANIGKSKKQKPTEPQIKQQPKYQSESFMQRPPTGKLKLNTDKSNKNNIYDAIRKIDDPNSQASSGVNSVHKPTLSFKKNKLLKPQHPNHLISQNNRSKQVDQLEQQNQNPINSNNPRPAPVFNRNKGKLLIGKSKQKPIISQQPVQQAIKQNKNRMAYVNDDQQSSQHNQQQPLIQQPSKKLIKPNLFKGLGQKRPQKLLNNSPLGPHKDNQKLLNNSQVYQQYTEVQNKKQKFNFQKMMNIQKAQINIERKIQEVSLQKVQKQSKRSKQLSQLLNLEMDLYESLVSISSTTPFQVYISKIKAGFLKNSCDQAFDQKNDVQCQTLSFEYIDFSNQCPQDYQLGHGFHQISDKNDSSQQYIDELVLRLSPVIQQLIKPSKQIIMPPTSLLAFNPVFRKFLKCPNPTFIYFSQSYNYSLVAIGQKLYICQDQIQCALDLGGSKLAGLKNGKIILWNGQNDRSSSTYNYVKQIIQSQNFELPVYVTNDFDKLSPYLCEGSIVAFVNCDERNSFYSFDSTAKLVKWNIQKVNRKTILVPKQLYQFSKILQKKHMVGFGMKKRNQIFYLWTSSGMICWDGHTVTQKLQAFGIKDFYLPKRSNLVYCLTQISTILIFSAEYHQILQQITIDTTQTFQQLIIPQLEHDNRQISIFYHIYLVSENGIIYEVKLTQNEVNSKKLGGKKSKQEDDNSGRSKRVSNVIYEGVNLLGNKIQKIRLFRDLKCATQSQVLSVDLESNVNNLKSIIMKNKQFLNGLMQRNICFV